MCLMVPGCLIIAGAARLVPAQAGVGAIWVLPVNLRDSPLLVPIWGPPAIELLERSVALDPDFAEGWLGLAWAHSTLGLLGFGAGSRDDLVRAREATQRGIRMYWK